MTLSPGSRLGVYEILGPIGSGGMGEVYRAKDTRLDRAVAIKVLPPSFRHEPALKARFHREAQLISSLNDPHICALYDVGEQDGVDFLVMELVEGQTLAARLARGPLRREEALRHAIDIASALASAHGHGIVHRDLKPGNVMLTRSGAKLLDFGLAKLRAADIVSMEAAGSTVTMERSGVTAAGTIIGTLNYMSPEQLEGKEADARSDIFAFGAVLYEMIIGRQAFDADSRAAVIGAILNKELAPITEIRDAPDPALERIVRRCVAKSPEERWQTAYDLARELEWVAQGDPLAAAATKSPARQRGVWVVAGLLLLLLSAVVTLTILRPGTIGGDATQFVVLPPEGAAFGGGPIDRVPSFALSPDGRTLAFIATDRSGRRALWVRSFGSLTAEPLAGTEGVLGTSAPFWSVDGTQIGFFARGKLKKVALSGGAPVTLANAPIGQGGTWNREGVILFTPDQREGLYRVSDAGGPATAATSLQAGLGDRAHLWPQFLPDGRHFIYVIRARQPRGGIYLGSLDSDVALRLLPVTFKAIHAPPGYLLFPRDGALMAQAFDASTRKVTGEPVSVTESVAFSTTNVRAAFTASANGALAYRSSGLLTAGSLVWADRSGKTIGSVGAPGDYQYLRLSPDETRLAAELHDLRTGTGDLWLLDLKRGSMSRVTFDGAHNNAAVWSPDGTRIVFAAQADGAPNVHVKSVNSSDADEPLLPFGPARIPTDWSPDGRHILFEQVEPKTRTDLWVLRLPERQPRPFVQTDFVERDARFSPDGRWVAYVSNESGRDEVYVQPFPASNSKWPISIQGGTAPRWRGDGKEIFYLAANNTLMSVSVRTATGFDPGVPQTLFKAELRNNTGYAVSVDGQRFLLNPDPPGPAAAPPIVVVVNWPAMLK